MKLSDDADSGWVAEGMGTKGAEMHIYVQLDIRQPPCSSQRGSQEVKDMPSTKSLLLLISKRLRSRCA